MKNLIISSLLSCLVFISCNEIKHNSEEFNRHPNKVEYSHHAKCRMGCRHIDETDIKNIIENGYINLKKSELNNDECHKRFALEGTSHNTRLRVVVAECNNVAHIITCIDLDKDWYCDCK